MFIHSGVVCAGSMLSNAVLHGIVGDKIKTLLSTGICLWYNPAQLGTGLGDSRIWLTGCYWTHGKHV